MASLTKSSSKREAAAPTLPSVIPPKYKKAKSNNSSSLSGVGNKSNTNNSSSISKHHDDDDEDDSVAKEDEEDEDSDSVMDLLEGDDGSKESKVAIKIGEYDEEEEKRVKAEIEKDYENESEEGREMERRVEDENDDGDAHIEKQMRRRSLRDEMLDDDDYQSIDNEDEDEIEEDMQDVFTQGVITFSRLHSQCNSLIYMTLLDLIFPDLNGLLEGKFNRVPEDFVSQAQALSEMKKTFLQEHYEFVKKVKAVMTSKRSSGAGPSAAAATGGGGKEDETALYTIYVNFVSAKKFVFLQIAGIYEGSKVPPLLEYCALTEKKLCAEGDKNSNNSTSNSSKDASAKINRSPGWLLVMSANVADAKPASASAAMVTEDKETVRVPLCQPLAVLFTSIYFLHKVEDIIEAEVGHRLLDIIKTHGAQTHFRYVHLYLSENLRQAASFYWHYATAKKNICTLLKLAPDARDLEPI
jgi:hypothetical protein